MHAVGFAIDHALVKRLLAGQFPAWADLPIERVEPSGTDNAIYRLGADMAIRLPRQRSSADVPAGEPGGCRRSRRTYRWRSPSRSRSANRPRAIHAGG